MENIQFQAGAINAGDCVGNAWELLKQRYGLYLGISLIAIILTGCIPCLNIFLIGPIVGGVFYVVLRDMRGEAIDFGMMFKGFEKFVPLMVIGLIQAIPGVLAQVLRFTINIGQLGLGGGRDGDFQFLQNSGRDLALSSGVAVFAVLAGLAIAAFALIWWGVFFFAIPLAVEHDLGPVDAIKLSARAASSNIGGLILIMLLEIVVMLLGVVMLCVGTLLISVPIIYIANAFAYRQVFPYAGGTNYNYAPPPPGAYGNFGGGMAG